MENNWYIKLHRQILNSEIWFKPADWLKIWCYILMTVNFKDNGLPSWSARFTYKQIEENCRVTRSTIDHFMRWAKIGDMISTKKATRLFIITVANYSQYQQLENESKATPKAIEKRQRGDREATLYNKNERMKEWKNISKDINTNVLESSKNLAIIKKWDEDINLFLSEIRKTIESCNLIYKKWTYERSRAKNILTWKDFWETCEKAWMTRLDFCKNIILVSTKLDFWNWKVYNCESLYKHYAQVYNEAVRMKETLKPKKQRIY